MYIIENIWISKNCRVSNTRNPDKQLQKLFQYCSETLLEIYISVFRGLKVIPGYSQTLSHEQFYRSTTTSWKRASE